MQISVLNKGPGETVMPTHLYIVYGCFHGPMAELSNFRQYDPQSPKYLLSGPPQKQFAELSS